MIENSSKNNSLKGKLHDKDKIMEEPLKLELPVRVFENGGRFHLAFSSLQAAENFVKVFWNQVDEIRGTLDSMSTARYFKSGMWKPSDELISGCRTGIMPATTEDREKGGVSSVFINGNTGCLQSYGVEALQKLGVSVIKT